MLQFDLNPNPDVQVHKRDKRRGLRANRLCCVYERLWATSGIVGAIIIVVSSSFNLFRSQSKLQQWLWLLIVIIMIIRIIMIIMIVMIIMMIINSGCASSPVQPRVPQQVRRQVA